MKIIIDKKVIISYIHFYNIFQYQTYIFPILRLTFVILQSILVRRLETYMPRTL